MRFIKKKKAPKCFALHSLKWTAQNKTWDAFTATNFVCKQRVRSYILGKEQYRLCAYCETELKSSRDAHLEHIEPQHSSSANRYDYRNLIVSCNGNCCSFVDTGLYATKHQKKLVHSCGHNKDKHYDANKFLNPTIEKNITDFFIFDNNTGTIKSSGKDDVKAKYTISLLNIDNIRLNLARKAAQEAIYKNLKNMSTAMAKTYLAKTLSTPREFISFLRHYYKNFI